MDNRGLTRDQKNNQRFVENLTKCHGKEFTVRPYDGLLVAVPKEAYVDLAPADSLLYELTSFGPTRQVGSGLLKYLTPGSVVPLFPAVVKLVDGDVDLFPTFRFMNKVFILSGAHHVDKIGEVIPGVHEYDAVIAAMADRTRRTPRSARFRSMANSVGADVLDATSKEALDPNYALGVFEQFFPEIPSNRRSDYVLFVTCTPKAALDYVFGNVDVLRRTEDEAASRNNKSSSGLWVSPKTLTVVMDNERSVKGTRCLCRMLMSNDNGLTFSPESLNSYYGSEMAVRDSVLKKFNVCLKKHLTFPRDACHKLPPSKFLVSTIASTILYDNPLPLSLPAAPEQNELEALVARLSVVGNVYVKYKSVSGVPPCDQVAAMSVGILKDSGVSPEHVRFYRNDVPADTDEMTTSASWPLPFSIHVSENTKRDLTDGSSEEDRQTVRVREAMRLCVFQLLTLFNYRDHIFNVDEFRTSSTLHEEAARANKNRNFDRQDCGLKGLKIKALCGWNVFKEGSSIVEHIFSRFHYDPMHLKRFFVANSLYLLRDDVALHRDIEKCPLPDKIEIVNGRVISEERRDDVVGDVYSCDSCGGTPFYERDGDRCLCFLFLKTVAALANKSMTRLADVRETAGDFVDNVSCNYDYVGNLTSYKTLHSVLTNELRSSSGHFGKIALEHSGRPNGFGTLKFLGRDDAASLDQQQQQQQPHQQHQQLQQTSDFSTDRNNYDVDGNTLSDPAEKDFATRIRETRSMEWICKRVMEVLGREATLMDPECSGKDDSRSSYLSRVQKIFASSDEVDTRVFTTGTRDNVVKRCRNILSTTIDGSVYPLSKTDPSPQLLRPTRRRQRQQQQEQQQLRRREDRQSEVTGPTNKRKSTGGWEVENCTHGGRGEKEREEEEEVAPKKKMKVEDKRRAQKVMTDFVASVFYKFLDGDENGDDVVDANSFHDRYIDLAKRWHVNPVRKSRQFTRTLHKFLFGADCGRHGARRTATADFHLDHSGFLVRVIESYLARISPFVSNVHSALADTLGLSRQELEADYRSIVHHGDTVKREIVANVDLHGTDSVTAKSQMLSVYEISRHEIEARGFRTTADIKARKEHAEALHKDTSGPHTVFVEGVAKVHVPTVADADENDDGPPILAVSETPAEDASVSFDMALPMKMKIALSATEQNQAYRAPGIASSFKVGTGNSKWGGGGGTEDDDDDDDEEEADDEDNNDDDDDNDGSDDDGDGYRRFVPRSLLNDYYGRSAQPVVKDTCKSKEELAAILHDFDFTRIGTPQAADILKKTILVEDLCRYLTSRKSASKIPHSHNVVVRGLMDTMREAVRHVLRTVQTIKVVMKRVLAVDFGPLENDLRYVEESVCDSKILADCFRAAAMRNVTLATGLYALALCSELYAHFPQPRGVDRDLERDNHAVCSVVAGCLRLFVGRKDCSRTTKSVDSKQSGLVPVVWTYLNESRAAPVVTTVDVHRARASNQMLLMNISSYTSSHGGSSVYTSLRGGAPMTCRVAPVIHRSVVGRKQMSDGEYNQIICQPLSTTVDKTSKGAGRDSIAFIVGSYDLDTVISHVMQNSSWIYPSLAAYYGSFLEEPACERTDEEVLSACLKVHGVQPTDSSAVVFRSLILNRVLATMRGTAVEERHSFYTESDEEGLWSEDDDDDAAVTSLSDAE